MSQSNEPTKYPTQEAAIAAAAGELEAGGVVTIHEEHCEQRGERIDDPDACTCTPMHLIVGENN